MRKNQLVTNLPTKFISHNLSSINNKISCYLKLGKYNIMPKTYIVKGGDTLLNLPIKPNQKMFFKNANLDRGDGIYIDSLINLSKMLENKPREMNYIIQHEIPPDLINRKKYCIRFYLLLTARGKIMYVHKRGAVYLAKEDYNPNTTSKFSQLTNFHIYADKKNYDVVRDTSVFDQSFPNYDNIFKQILHMCSCIYKEYNTINIPNNAILGLDTMVDKNGKCWLLESNSPDMSTDGYIYDNINKIVGDDTVKLFVNLEKLEKLKSRSYLKSNSNHGWIKID
jgi:hypothetical protein